MCVSSTYFRPACMLHVLVQFARTEYEYKPRKAKPSPPSNRSGPMGGINSTQATPTTLGLNIHIRKSPEKSSLLFCFFFEPFEQQCCSVVLSILKPLV